MTDYISREAAIEKLKEERNYTGKFSFEEEHAWSVGFQQGISFALSDIASIPAADVREVKRGRWRDAREDMCLCTSCGWGFLLSYKNREEDAGLVHRFKYCPNCGADMREES